MVFITLATKMSKKLDKINIGPKYDGRRKISEEQKLQMHKLYNEGKAIREITRIVGCSRRSVQFELFPERNAINKKNQINAKRWEKYNTKDIRRVVMRKHRAKKRELLNLKLIS